MPLKLGIIGIDHGHIFGMLANMQAQGCTCDTYWTDGPAVTETKFNQVFPEVKKVNDRRQILDADLDMILISAVPADRARFAVEAMDGVDGANHVPFFQHFVGGKAFAVIFCDGEESGRLFNHDNVLIFIQDAHAGGDHLFPFAQGNPSSFRDKVGRFLDHSSIDRNAASPNPPFDPCFGAIGGDRDYMLQKSFHSREYTRFDFS